MKKRMLSLLALMLILGGCSAPIDRHIRMSSAQATRAAMEEVAYTPACITHLQSATLTWTSPQENREIVHAAALTDAKGLNALEKLLKEAEEHQPTACFDDDVRHELTLTLQSGAVVRLLVATDSCCMLRADDTYYTFEPVDSRQSDLRQDNQVLYGLFGASVY